MTHRLRNLLRKKSRFRVHIEISLYGWCSNIPNVLKFKCPKYFNINHLTAMRRLIITGMTHHLGSSLSSKISFFFHARTILKKNNLMHKNYRNDILKRKNIKPENEICIIWSYWRNWFSIFTTGTCQKVQNHKLCSVQFCRPQTVVVHHWCISYAA